MKYFLKLLIIVLFLTGCEQSIPEPKTISVRAESFLSIDYDSVIYYANLHIKNSPHDEELYYSYYLIGYAHQKQQDYTRSAVNYLTALELIPNDDRYKPNKASILKNLGSIAKTVRAYDYAIKYYNQSLSFVAENEKAGVLYNLGNVYTNQNQYDQSFELFSQSADLAFKFGQEIRYIKATINKGVTLARQKNLDESDNFLLSAINWEKDRNVTRQSGRAYHYLGNNKLEQSEYERAIVYFKKAINNFSSDTDLFITYMDMGDCYLRMGETQLAQDYLQKAAVLYKVTEPNLDYAKVYNLIATAYERKGDTANALKYQRSYGAELEDFLQQKEEIIMILNKQGFEQLVSHRASVKELLIQVFTYKNTTLWGIVGICICLSFIGFRVIRWQMLKRELAREIRSI
ncbi:MAG: tetratricopeptide repeat protein [Cyclobacteriaceae bacterium]